MRTPMLAAVFGVVVLAALGACESSDSAAPVTVSDTLRLTAAQIGSLDSTGQAMMRANPGNPDIEALVDSTLQVLTAGVQAKRLDVTTDLTGAPLYFVGIHRTFRGPTSSSSTWTLVGFDDPSHLANLVEVSGFAQAGGASAPSSVSGTIGDGSGIVNAVLFQVGTGGAVTEWRVASGTASFASEAGGAACSGFVATRIVSCSLETMHVHFNATATNSTSGSRHAAVVTDVDVPALRFSYTP